MMDKNRVLAKIYFYFRALLPEIKEIYLENQLK